MSRWHAADADWLLVPQGCQPDTIHHACHYPRPRKLSHVTDADRLSVPQGNQPDTTPHACHHPLNRKSYLMPPLIHKSCLMPPLNPKLYLTLLMQCRPAVSASREPGAHLHVFQLRHCSACYADGGQEQTCRYLFFFAI